jgi:hypothetical protein
VTHNLTTGGNITMGSIVGNNQLYLNSECTHPYSPNNYSGASAPLTINTPNATNNRQANIRFTHSGTTEGNLSFIKDNSSGHNEVSLVWQSHSQVTGQYSEKFRIHDEGAVTMPLQPFAKLKFQIGDSGASALKFTGSEVVLKPSNITNNIGGCYSVSNGRFTAPVSGVYRISFSSNIMVASATSFVGIKTYRNGGINTFHYENILPISWQFMSFSESIYCNAGDYLTVNGDVGSGSAYVDHNSYSFLQFELVY